MVRDALKVMKTTLDKVKGMVEFFHKSTRATEKLKSTQRQMDMPELRLKQDCATRWNSTLYMLKRVLESKDAIISTLALINAHIDALDQEEWEALQETCTVLEPFEQVTVEISSERIRADFVQKVPMPVIKGILDDLWQKKVLSTEDKDFVMENQTSKVDKARCLIDMVMGKGDRASQMMVDSLKDRDGELWFSLGLIPYPGMELSRIRVDFVEKVEMPVIKRLVDYLWEKCVLYTKEKYSVMETSKVDRARCLIDIVMGKGDRASQMMVDRMKIYPVMAPDARTSPALLITNVHFHHMPLRKGAEKDEQNMENLLTFLGYTVVKYRDLSGVQMDEAIEKFSKDARLPEADSVFVVIMSHGQRGAVLGVRHSSDGEADTLPVDNIYKHLNSERCPGLLNKPKVIIIQACRGDMDGSVSIPDGPGSVGWATCVQVDGFLQPQLEDTEEHIEDDGFRRVHKEKDMIAFLSCTPGEGGFNGQKGEVGLQGFQGATGEKGERGLNGTADQGEPGNEGPAGPPGLAGETGPKGDKGDRGECGTFGERGNKGDRGEPGHPGIPGAMGHPGLNGKYGPQVSRACEEIPDLLDHTGSLG
ncbi:hypothetical protein NHX12_000080 [Muraenolepis orangiensis]|uniref:Caspase-8 n=2 Tax=Muraenolepis orangiensis TaxID=630683 RepID=A0A9Q0D866_9TELE|nr:hypothetical protein NHX12_000080 [Muraenolepis orangiensis]